MQSIDLKNKKVPCVCMSLPCVHNPEVPDEMAEDIVFRGYRTKKGIKIVFLDWSKMKVLEQTDNVMMVQVLE